MDSEPLNGSKIDEVVELFIDNNVLLYHGISPSRKIDGQEIPYEKKVRFCMNGNNKDGFSCSTITSTDIFRKNYFEPVGLIVRPIEILLCNKADLGYSKEADFITSLILFGNPTIEKCEDAILNRNEMNEFLVSKFEVQSVGLSSQFTFKDAEQECKRIAKELGVNRVIKFGKGFINENSKSITAADIYS